MNIGSLFSDGLSLILNWQTLLVLVAGIILGVVAGSLPGFAGANTCAIMLPLTLKMTTVNAMVLMGAIYVGVNYGGGVTSILFNVPGTSSAAATALDGYPLTKQGKPGYALGVSMLASAAGSITAAIIAIFATVPLANVALKFGPAEMFLVALMGIVVITSVMGEDSKKGLLTAALGFMVAIMPADPYYGVARCTFGFFEIYDEIPLIAALIGLFALPTIIDMCKTEYIVEQGTELKHSTGAKSIFEGIKVAVKKPFKVLWASLVGTIIGAIPGTGAGIASFVCYGQFVNMSKEPETFGKGNPEGVIAAEASNNGVAGGAMIPTFALGIPGSGTTAVMLSALTLHGIIPGPNVIRDNGDMVYGFLITLLIGALLIIPVGIAYGSIFSKATKLKTGILVPMLVILSLLGAFGERQFMFDMYLFMIFGLLGLMLKAFKCPVVPFLFGVILGPIAEEKFLQAITISQNSMSIFFSSPICIIMWIVIAMVFLSPWITKNIKRLKEKRSK